MTAVLALEDVRKTYPGPVDVLHGVSLSVAAGELAAVVGPSGSGKSTLIRCINRLEEHQQGRIIVEGVELTRALRNSGG